MSNRTKTFEIKGTEFTVEIEFEPIREEQGWYAEDVNIVQVLDASGEDVTERFDKTVELYSYLYDKAQEWATDNAQDTYNDNYADYMEERAEARAERNCEKF